MQSEPLAHENESPDPVGRARLLWNGEPFRIVGAVRRKAKIVRTKLVPAELRRRYNASGWPRDLVIMREHSLKLPGEDVTLKVVTNADEAEDEIPDSIETPIRDTGTFRDALVIWRGRPVRSFVSARLAPAPAGEPIAAYPMKEPSGPMALHEPDIARGSLQSGLVVPPQGFLAEMSPDEREIANYLIARRDGGGVYSLSQIAARLRVSDETVRRRKLALEQKYPPLRAVFASFRSRFAKGDAVPPPHLFGTRPAPADDHA